MFLADDLGVSPFFFSFGLETRKQISTSFTEIFFSFVECKSDQSFGEADCKKWEGALRRHARYRLYAAQSPTKCAAI